MKKPICIIILSYCINLISASNTLSLEMSSPETSQHITPPNLSDALPLRLSQSPTSSLLYDASDIELPEDDESKRQYTSSQSLTEECKQTELNLKKRDLLPFFSVKETASSTVCLGLLTVPYCPQKSALFPFLSTQDKSHDLCTRVFSMLQRKKSMKGSLNFLEHFILQAGQHSHTIKKNVSRNDWLRLQYIVLICAFISQTPNNSTYDWKKLRSDCTQYVKNVVHALQLKHPLYLNTRSCFFKGLAPFLKTAALDQSQIKHTKRSLNQLTAPGQAYLHLILCDTLTASR